jgi:hypothetical protein
MLVEASGRDAFTEIKAGGTPRGKFIQRLPSPFAAAAINGLVPAAAAATFAVVPAGVPLKIATSYFASILGTAGRRRLVPGRDEAALIELAALLDGDFASVTPEQVAAVGDKYGVSGDEFEAMRVDLFAKFVLAMLKNPEFKPAELRELSALHKTLFLTAEQLGDAFFGAIEETYRRNVMWTTTKDLEDEESLERMTVNKCIFLASRVIGEHDTVEGLQYTLARCRQLLQMNKKDFELRCLNTAAPLYKRALDTVIAKLESVSVDDLAKARTSLGITIDDVNDMHSEMYRDEVVNLLEASDPMKLNSSARTRLDKLQSVLGLSDDEAISFKMDEVVPIYEYDVISIMEAVVEGPDAASNAVARLEARQTDLGLMPDSAKDVLISTLQKSLSGPFDEAVQFIRLENKRGALGAMVGVLDAKDAATVMLDACYESGLLSRDDVDAFFLGALNMRIVSPTVARELYSLLLGDALENGDEDTMAAVADMETIMDLNDAMVEAVYTDVCGPLLHARLLQSLTIDDAGATLSPDAKQANEAFVKSMRIPAALFEAVKTDIYANKLAEATAKGRIMSVVERDDLDTLRAFLDVGNEKAFELHLDACGSAFRQSVSEAMGATGVINADYKDGLAKLGDRLMLSETDQTALYFGAIRDRVTPMVDKIVSEFERSVLSKDQYGAKTGKDQGEDLFVQGGTTLGLEAGANLLLEVVNLVDFFEGNKLWEAEGDSDVDFTYLISAKGARDAQLLEDVFRQFIVSSFQAKSPDSENRYKLAQTHFAGILGITGARRAEIQNDIGKVVYGNYVNNLLRSKGCIETPDFQYLVNIQQMLNMDEDLCMSELIDLKVKFAKILVAEAYKEPQLTASVVQRLKIGVDKLGVDLVDDVRLDLKRRLELFVAESIAVIESGKTLLEGKVAIEDIQENWQVSDSDATEAFTKAVHSICEESAKQASLDLKSKNDLQVVEGMEKIVKFGQYVTFNLDEDGTKHVEIDERVKQNLIQLYATAKGDFKEDMTEEEEANIALLNHIL